MHTCIVLVGVVTEFEATIRFRDAMVEDGDDDVEAAAATVAPIFDPPSHKSSQTPSSNVCDAAWSLTCTNAADARVPSEMFSMFVLVPGAQLF